MVFTEKNTSDKESAHSETAEFTEKIVKRMEILKNVVALVELAARPTAATPTSEVARLKAKAKAESNDSREVYRLHKQISNSRELYHFTIA